MDYLNVQQLVIIFFSKKKIPLDPWGKPFIYAVPGANNTHRFDLSCISPKENQLITGIK